MKGGVSAVFLFFGVAGCHWVSLVATEEETKVWCLSRWRTECDGGWLRIA